MNSISDKNKFIQTINHEGKLVAQGRAYGRLFSLPSVKVKKVTKFVKFHLASGYQMTTVNKLLGIKIHYELLITFNECGILIMQYH